VSRNISGKFKKICRLNFLELNFDFFDSFCRQLFFIFPSWNLEVCIYSCTNFRVPYRTRFGNNHGFIPRGQSFSHSARSMNWHARTCFRRRISRKTRTKKFLVSSKYQIYVVFSCHYQKYGTRWRRTCALWPNMATKYYYKLYGIKISNFNIFCLNISWLPSSIIVATWTSNMSKQKSPVLHASSWFLRMLYFYSQFDEFHIVIYSKLWHKR
jgi:hypothetical protein